MRLVSCCIAALCLAACGGPSGSCSGTLGPSTLNAELGGETKVLFGGGLERNRIARMVLDYGDGALFVDTELWLPANQGMSAVPFGEGAPERPIAEGLVTRFRVPEPKGAPAVRSGVFTVRQASATHLEGQLDVTFADASQAHCTFDVSGKTTIEDDQIPIEPPLGPIEP
ncbi:hypothetical protein FGE12_02980 [Aggregicoccus sp. 17bor-14]|uniref:hypothetical protein n=1 Tax=Myxococcaceae TaxID=31 RepID=UPI00129CE75A|nr:MULTISPECIES: hypothetical protein [Myxococcaceae]MBF5041335.1 hypothetical protein [Simulacricoccus sp. 17bor-14]MRI87121.1 hypothetical protein [Aggregicoccus sp. 17bor-14]